MRLIETGQSRVEVKREVYDRYNEKLDEACRNLILLQKEGAPEKNYYVNEFGRVQVNAPWYGPEFHLMCSRVDWDELEIT